MFQEGQKAFLLLLLFNKYFSTWNGFGSALGNFARFSSSSVLLHWTVTQPEPQMTWQKRLSKTARFRHSFFSFFFFVCACVCVRMRTCVYVCVISLPFDHQFLKYISTSNGFDSALANFASFAVLILWAVSHPKPQLTQLNRCNWKILHNNNLISFAVSIMQSYFQSQWRL